MLYDNNEAREQGENGSLFQWNKGTKAKGVRALRGYFGPL